MSEHEAKITLTKLEAAQRQLETAARLWFAESDAVSIHTLVAAAHRVVHDLSARQGSGAFLLDTQRLTEWGYDSKAFKKAIRHAETFFKHAENDPDATYTFSSSEAQYIFYSAIECFHRLVPERSQLLALFIAWFHLRHPDTLSERARDLFADILPEISKLSRREFFEQVGNADFRRLI